MLPLYGSMVWNRSLVVQIQWFQVQSGWKYFKQADFDGNVAQNLEHMTNNQITVLFVDCSPDRDRNREYSKKQTKGSIVIIEIAPSNLEDPWN